MGQNINNSLSETYLLSYLCLDLSIGCKESNYFSLAVSPITGHVVGNQNLTFVQSPTLSGNNFKFRFCFNKISFSPQPLRLLPQPPVVMSSTEGQNATNISILFENFVS